MLIYVYIYAVTKMTENTETSGGNLRRHKVMWRSVYCVTYTSGKMRWGERTAEENRQDKDDNRGITRNATKIAPEEIFGDRNLDASAKSNDGFIGNLGHAKNLPAHSGLVCDKYSTRETPQESVQEAMHEASQHWVNPIVHRHVRWI